MIHSTIIQGIELSGVAGGLINFIQGSTLGHQRYLAIWAKNGYDVQNPDFLRWLFGENGNNTQRAGALTVDMLGGHELILQESSQWLTLIGAGMGAGAGHNWNAGIDPPMNPAVIAPIIWVILAAVAVYFSKQTTSSASAGWFG